jgi:hypothetical protein
MSESFIEPDSLNSILLSLGAVVDENGSTRFLNKELASYNFDGMIPTSSDTISVNELKVGMSFLPIGETEGSLKTVIKVEFDDPQMTGSPTNNYIISYLGTNGEIQTVTYDGSSQIEVYFEDWEDKVLGDNGWVITQEGNAIFSNVAVRGRIEATEGLIDGDLTVTGSLATSETASATGGVVFNNTGILAYDTSGNNTFFLDSSNGDITIFGTPGDDLLTGGDVADTGTTVISANRITTGSVTGRVFRSNSSMTPTSGDGVYLDGEGRVRFSDPDATFTFNSSGLNITNGSNATLTFNSTGLSISGAGVTIGGTNPDNFITGTEVDANITQIDGGKITTGIIDSNFPAFIGTADGAAFATQGMAINLNNGTITTEQFRIDASGNAFFSGNLSAATGSFSGALSAATGTFSGTLSAGVSINSPLISGGSITGATLSTQSLSSPSAYITLTDSTVRFYDQGVLVGGIYGDNVGSTLWVQPDLTINGDVMAFGNIEVFPGGTRRFIGNGSGLSGTATSLSIGGNAATATRATDANNLDSGATGGARITGNNVLVTSIGSGTTSDETLRRNSSNQMRSVAASSRKIKTEISPIEDINVLGIDVVQFKYINGYLDEYDQRYDTLIPGFIAEQVFETLPVAVDLDENNEPKNWNERILIPVIVKTIQDQQKTIEDLKEKVLYLQGVIKNG